MQSRFALARRLLAFIVMLSLLLAAPSQAQWQRGGLSRTFNTYSPPPQPRYTPPRPMMPQQVMTPRTPQFTAAARGPTMAPGSTTGIRMARPLPLPPSIRQNSAIAQMPSYTKRVTITGAPIVVSRTKIAYSVPQQGVFGTRIVTTYRPIRIVLVQRFGSLRIATLRQQWIKIASIALPRSIAQNPYSARDNRSSLENSYGKSNVTSSTVPPSNKPNVKLASQEKWIKRSNGVDTRITFDSRGFPVFDTYAKFDTRFQAEDFNKVGSDAQMKMATRDLASALERGAASKKDFNDMQLGAISRGEARIPGYTWHHHQDVGRMQLVPTDIHDGARHIGGSSMIEGR